MPFLAYLDPDVAEGELVVPEEVADGVDVRCPSCDGRMRPRGGGVDQRARHFFHVTPGNNPGAEGCTGAGDRIAESKRHRIMKSLAVSGLRRRFDRVASVVRCGTEGPVDVSASRSPQEARRADALVEFETENQFFGRGVIVEVQHANASKNIPQVTADYLRANFSVFWADESCFEDDEFRIEVFDQAFENQTENAYSVYFDSPSDVWDTYDITEWFSVPDGWQLNDPKPDCSHEFEKDGASAICARCQTRYQLHRESQRPIFEPPSLEPHEYTMTEVRGGGETYEPDDTPHIHLWTRKRSGEYSNLQSCSRCHARKLSTATHEVIDYTRRPVDQLETREMKQCHHEWRRTGSGEECWKCGKPKSDVDHWGGL